MLQVSVVIPTYKRPGLLLRCLECLELQTLPKDCFEALVISDGFDQATEAAVYSYMQRSRLHLTYLCTARKKGPAAARNMGWRQAQAPLIAFTDDDCQPAAEWLEAFTAAFDGTVYKAFTGFTQVPLPDNPTDFALNTAHLQTASFITANCACTKTALKDAGGFDERFAAAWREDSDLEFKLSIRNIPIIRLEQAVVTHPVRLPVPWGISIREQKKSQYNALLYKKFPKLYRRHIQSAPPLHYYGIVLLAVLTAVSFLAHGLYAGLAAFLLCSFLVLQFFFKRIRPLPKSGSCVWEMLLTSWVIPFVAVYWRLYGAVRFRVIFL